MGKAQVEAARAVRYSGQEFSPLGEKGRFVLPSDFRKAVRDSSGGERILCLTKHARWKCLTAFGLSRGDELLAELDREERVATERGLDFDRDQRQLQLFGYSKVSFDDSGRFIMPERYLKLSGITTGAFFQGGGNSFTIWSPDELAKMGAGWEDAQEACAEYMAKAESARARK